MSGARRTKVDGSEPKDTSPSTIACRRIREVRQERDLKQQEVIDLLREKWAWPEMTRATLAKIERGARKPTIDELLVLAAALGTSPVHLLTPEDEWAFVKPTPIRAMTSRRCRDWITGKLRLREQDKQAHYETSQRAEARSYELWERKNRHHNAYMAVVGVEVEDGIEVDPEREASPEGQAAIELMSLLFAVEELHEEGFKLYGASYDPAPLDDLGAKLTFDGDASITVTAAQTLWSRSALDEYTERREVVWTSAHQQAEATGVDYMMYAEQVFEDERRILTDVLTELHERARVAWRSMRTQAQAPPAPVRGARTEDTARPGTGA